MRKCANAQISVSTGSSGFYLIFCVHVAFTSSLSVSDSNLKSSGLQRGIHSFASLFFRFWNLTDRRRQPFYFKKHSCLLSFHQRKTTNDHGHGRGTCPPDGGYHNRRHT
jgi:hypothetical protein